MLNYAIMLTLNTFKCKCFIAYFDNVTACNSTLNYQF